MTQFEQDYAMEILENHLFEIEETIKTLQIDEDVQSEKLMKIAEQKFDYINKKASLKKAINALMLKKMDHAADAMRYLSNAFPFRNSVLPNPITLSKERYGEMMHPWQARYDQIDPELDRGT